MSGLLVSFVWQPYASLNGRFFGIFGLQNDWRTIAIAALFAAAKQILLRYPIFYSFAFVGTRTKQMYGPAYVKFAKQGIEYLQSSRSAGVFTLPLRIMPLRVVKQVICMTMSVNGPKFQGIQRDLVRFVLNKELRHLPNHVRLFAFYSIGDRSRSAGVSGLLKGYGSAFSTGYVFSEITFPPFGFVLTFNCAAPDDRLTDISHFADDFGYKDERTVWIRLPVLPVYAFYPGDYRNRDTVLKDAEKNLGSNL